MLMVIGMSVFVIGAALIPAAHIGFRHPAVTPHIKDWIGGETAGVILTTIPATGLIALFYFLVDKSQRDISVLHVAIALAIATAGWFAVRWLIRLGARLEEAAHEQEKATVRPVFPERRAA